MSDWGVVTRMPAEISLADGSSLKGEIHLQGLVPNHEGPETALEMRDRPEPFFPVALEQGGVLFLSKAQTTFVTCPPQSAAADPERFSAAKLVGLEVTMYDGTQLRGWATLELPPTRARALDYLNGSGPFFSLWTDASIWIINRFYARVVRPLD